MEEETYRHEGKADIRFTIRDNGEGIDKDHLQRLFEPFSAVPIIALTANAFDEDVRMSLDAGMNAHLSKPVEPDVLFALLTDIL